MTSIPMQLGTKKRHGTGEYKAYGRRGKPSAKYVREQAIGAVRSYMRAMVIDPLTRDSQAAYMSLMDFPKIHGMAGTYVENFARTASERQIKLFKRDWDKWRKDTIRWMKVNLK